MSNRWIHIASAFQPTSTAWVHHESQQLSAIRIGGYDEAFRVIDECAETGELSLELEEAVRFLEVNSYKIYPNKDPSHRHRLWETAQGSWKLTATTGSHLSRVFRPPPNFLPFSFAMVDGTYFGNGIGIDNQHVGLAFLHQAHYHAAHRRLTVTHPDLYLFGHKVQLPDFLRPKLLKMIEEDESNGEHVNGAASTTESIDKKHHDPPTFVLIAASDKALIARGNQSGGLALWTRLSQDIRPFAYKKYPMAPANSYHPLPQ